MAKKLTDKTMVEVINNSGGVVFYVSEINRATRRWDIANASKKISLEELKELVNSAGGYQLLTEDLLIKDVDVREELGLPVDTVSMLDDEAVLQILSEPVSKLKEVLESSNDTIREKIVNMALKSELSDMKKLEAIKELTDVDVYELIKDKTDK